MDAQNAGPIGEPAARVLDLTATVVIAIPCQDQVSAGFTYDLARLVGFVTKHHPNVHLHLVMNRGTLIADQRHVLVQEAKARGATHILWLDSDMRFPKDVLSRFLAFNLPIVAANYATRRTPVLPTAENAELGMVFNQPGDQALVSVDRVGMGCMLVDMQVFAKIGDPPWFAIGFNKAASSYIGEDVYFCRMAKKAGCEVWIDPVLSNEVRHLGEFQYSLRHAAVTLESSREAKLVSLVAAEPREAAHGTAH